jgi:FHA domain
MAGTYVIELDDRALTLASGGEILSSAPSVVFDGGGPEPAGYPAWNALRRQPTTTSTRHFRELAREPSARRAASLIAADIGGRLAANPPSPGSSVWIASAAQFDARALGALLGIAGVVNVQVEGVVDAAVARVAALGIDRTALVLELGLHHVAVTSVQGGGQARRRRVIVGEGGGLIELYEAWLDLVSAAMVKRTRFDPLHEGATEQQLFEALPDIARTATETGSAMARVTVGNDVFETPLTRDQLAQAGESIYREVLRLLHELRPAGTPIALLVPRTALELPGLREAFDQFIGCELVALADGFAAAAASLMDLPAAIGGENVRLMRRLPPQLLPTLDSLAARELLGREGAPAPQASHVLFNGKAFSLSRDALVVGRAPSAAHAINLSEGLAGVSRRHCTFVRIAGETILVDHSSFGTFVNGERVAERVRVHAGDRVRIGEPGVELSLIAIGDGAGSVHGTPPR